MRYQFPKRNFDGIKRILFLPQSRYPYVIPNIKMEEN